MKRFSILHIPLLSFFSKELYRDVGLNWKGVGFAYLLLLLAICSVPRMFKLQRGLLSFIDKDVPPLIEQVPRITITNGELSIEESQPYYIKDPDSNDVLVIIDTTGEIQSLDDTNALALVTKTKVVYRKSEVETQMFDLAQVKDFVLDKDRMMGWLNIVKKFLLPVLYPFVVLWSFLFRTIQVLIYGAIGLLFASWCRAKLSYDALLRLAVVAVTPCIIVRTIFEVASVRFPMAGLWFFLIAMAYLFFGVKANSQDEKLTPQDNVFPGNQQTL